MLDSYHSCFEGDTSADVSQFSASFWGVDAHPGPPTCPDPGSCSGREEGRSHTEKIPPVQHNTATVLITGRGKMPQSDILFVLISLLIQSGEVQQPFC